MKSTKAEQVKRFTKELQSQGEYYWSVGSTEQDYNHITEVLAQQGYWSGVYNRYYFSDELFLVNTTPRVFGGATV